MRYALIAVLLAAVARAEDLSARDAVLKALANHPSLSAAAAATQIAAAKTAEMRGARLPRVNWTEEWQRSDNPVYVFGSLLDQRQFQAQNFDLGSLNHP